nr:hypothetical protein [Tanacetum cinerariifolium]
HRIQLLPIKHSAHVKDIVEFETAIAQIFLYLSSFFIISSIALQTPGSGISNLLAVGTSLTGSGNLYCQWELFPGKSAPTFAELFETNELKAQIQEKDTVILKLKEKIKSSSGDVKERKVERKVEEIETQNLELDHKVTKLIAEIKHLKQTYKQLFDSIKSSRVQSKEKCDDLINKVNLKSVEVADLNASLQEKSFGDYSSERTAYSSNVSTSITDCRLSKSSFGI